MTVIEKMFSVSSSEIIYLDEKTIKSMEKVPFFDEWLKANCGEYLSAEELSDIFRLIKVGEKRELSRSERLRMEHLEQKRLRFSRCRFEKVYEAQLGKKP